MNDHLSIPHICRYTVEDIFTLGWSYNLLFMCFYRVQMHSILTTFNWKYNRLPETNKVMILLGT